MAAPSPLLASLNVALGGGIGAVLRYQLGRTMTGWIGPQAMGAFPWATLAVNLVGSLAMGLLAGWLGRQGEAGEPYRLLLGVGLLGGFTTFSTFSADVFLDIDTGAPGEAFAILAASIAGGVAAAACGYFLGRTLAH